MGGWGLLEIEGKRAEASGSQTPHLTFILHDWQISQEEINSALSRAVTSVRSQKTDTNEGDEKKRTFRPTPPHFSLAQMGENC